MKPAERALSVKQALACEAAIESRCRCRCRGLLHGRRQALAEKELSALPADDPHFVKPEKDTFLRKVLEASKPEYYYTQIRLSLECGHEIWFKKSRPLPSRVHCRECKVAAKKERSRAAFRALNEGAQAKKVPSSSAELFRPVRQRVRR